MVEERKSHSKTLMCLSETFFVVKNGILSLMSTFFFYLIEFL